VADGAYDLFLCYSFIFYALSLRPYSVFVLGLCGFIFGVFGKPYATYADSFSFGNLSVEVL